MPKIINANCETGEIVESEMSESEHEIYQLMVSNIETAISEIEFKESQKASAKAKLALFGLTDSEIEALLP